MPLDTQNTKLGAMDVRFTPQAFNSIKPMASIYDATNTNLIRFHTLRGKLIIYHGYFDPSIGHICTIAYYNAKVKQMGGLDATQKIAIFFMLPDVYRCGEGCGTSHFDIVTAITT